MSRTFKDKANHFVHKLIPTGSYNMIKSKHQYTEDDIPKDVKALADVLRTGRAKAGLRHGNNRKYEANLKLEARKKVRLLDKKDMRKPDA